MSLSGTRLGDADSVIFDADPVLVVAIQSQRQADILGLGVFVDVVQRFLNDMEHLDFLVGGEIDVRCQVGEIDENAGLFEKIADDIL